MILAIETSCDDTCAARRRPRDGEIRANVISSQGIHDRYGGVVPEVASRHHLELVNPVRRRRAAHGRRQRSTTSTSSPSRQGPGLVGALLVGVATAKALAAARGLPLAPVDHLQGHVAANFLRRRTPFEPPFLCLIASGGHTLLARVEDHDGFEVLGDDARRRRRRGVRQGRAPARARRYPGGPALERLAAEGDPAAFAFPIARSGVAGLDFSFAGLKTALLYTVRDLGEEDAAARRADLAASYQRAIVEALALRVERALEQTGLRAPGVGGGVAANGPLRERLAGLGVAAARPAARAVHRQRGDDRQRRALRRRRCRTPTTSALDAYATGERARCERDAARSSLYGRPGCHLCDDARAVLERIRARRAVRAREVDIEGDDALLRAYLERIPVVALDGERAVRLLRRRGRARAARLVE